MSRIPGLCYAPVMHAAEHVKRETILRESELKDFNPADHPGWNWGACASCGNFHPREAFTTSDEGAKGDG